MFLIWHQIKFNCKLFYVIFSWGYVFRKIHRRFICTHISLFLSRIRVCATYSWLEVHTLISHVGFYNNVILVLLLGSVGCFKMRFQIAKKTNQSKALNDSQQLFQQNILFPSTKWHNILGLGSNYIWPAAVYKCEQQTVQ